jgi:hypothetical protein
MANLDRQAMEVVADAVSDGQALTAHAWLITYAHQTGKTAGCFTPVEVDGFPEVAESSEPNAIQDSLLRRMVVNDQHGLRHMGEIVLARGLVGLQGMTS